MKQYRAISILVVLLILSGTAKSQQVKELAFTDEEIAKQELMMAFVGDATVQLEARINRTQTYLPRPIQNENDAQACLNTASAFAQTVFDATGKRAAWKIARRNEYVYQKLNTKSGHITRRYYPDGRLVIHHVVNSKLAYLNIFGKSNERLMHAEIEPKMIKIKCNGATLGLKRKSFDNLFTREGDWSKIDEPTLLSNYLVPLQIDPRDPALK